MAENRPSTKSFRLARTSIGVLLVAMLVTAVAGWLAFLISRQAVLNSVAHESLSLAQTLVNNVEFELNDSKVSSQERTDLLEHIAEVWEHQERPFDNSFVCVVGSNGNVELHSAKPDMVGISVASSVINPNAAERKTILDLLASKGSLAVQNKDFFGNDQLAGYAYSPSMDALVVVHVPASSVESHFLSTALPWVLALAFMATLLIPISIGLSHLGYLSSDREAEQARQSQRQSDRRFKAIFDSTFQFIGLMSVDGTLLEANQTALNFGGLKKEDVLNKPFWETYWWRGDDDRVQQLKGAIARAAQGEFVRYSVSVLGAESEEIIDFTIQPVFNDDGKVVLLVPEGRLITEQRVAEVKLAESEERLKAVIDTEPECVKLLDKDGRVLSLNPAGLKMVEAESLDQVLHQSIFPVIDDEHREAYMAMHERVMQGETAQLEFGMYSLNGAHRWMDTHASPFRDATGKVIGHLAVTRDITQKKMVEKQLRFTQFSVDACSSPIFWIRQDASFFYVNEAAALKFGYPRDALLSMSVHDIDPSYPAEVWPDYWENMQKKKTLNFTTEIKCRDGFMIPVEISTHLLETEGEEFVFAFVTDIAERKVAEDLIRVNEARFRALVENSYDVISMFSTNGRMVYTSPSVKRVLGYEPAQIIDINPGAILHPDDRESVAAVIKQLVGQADSISHGIYRLRHKNGSYRTVEATATNLLDEPGVNSIVTIFRDITERYVAEERLRERETALAHVARVSTMGEIAAGIAHEIKQPLHAVANFATATTVALRSAPEDSIQNPQLSEDLVEWNGAIKTAAQRATAIVQRLRKYANKSDQSVETASVVTLIGEAIDLIAFETRRHKVEIETDIPTDLPDVNCDRIQIYQVLVNLLKNAYEVLKLSNSDERKIWIRATQMEGQIQLSISDNGSGIDTKKQGKIFDAFYTTKPNGMGMGLAISRTIVEDHGGSMSVEENEYGGATFAFTLPVASKCLASSQERVDAV